MLYARISQNGSRDIFDELQVEDPGAASQYSDKEYYSRIEKYLTRKTTDSLDKTELVKGKEEKSKIALKKHKKHRCPKGWGFSSLLSSLLISFLFLVIVKKLSDSDYAISMYNFFMK